MSRLTFRSLAQVAAASLVVSATGAQSTAQPTATRAARRAAGADSARIRADVAYLADDRLEGRLTGSPGNDSAAAYIARRFGALGLRPVVGDPADVARCAAVRKTPAAGCEASYLQRFTARVQAFAHAGRPFELATQNVAALIPGTDPALRGQLIVLGAHYDHLGRDGTFAADPQAGDAIRNGADDNASGTAAVLELARLVSARPTRRSVLVVAFSGEEEGTLGSQWFADHLPVPVDSVVAMLNFDMVGRLTNDRLIVYGVGTADELPGIVDAANVAGPRLAVRTVPDGIGPSDHTPFHLKGLPVLHFFTDTHADYHAAGDDAEKIDAAGEARIVDLAHAVARTIADSPSRLTFRATRASARMSGDPTAGPRPYFGSIPDMAGEPGTGMRLNGVTPGSPADQGGLKAGDVVVEFGGKAVTDLYSYTDALNARKPGDTITVVVRRAGAAGTPEQRVALTVTLTRRGQ